MIGRRLNSEEIEKIREMYPQYPTRVIARIMRVPVVKVASVATRFRLRKSAGHMAYLRSRTTIDQLVEQEKKAGGR